MNKKTKLLSRDSLNCVSLAAVASSVEGPERSTDFTDNQRQWGHSG